jgi:hypothetical protein
MGSFGTVGGVSDLDVVPRCPKVIVATNSGWPWFSVPSFENESQSRRA